MLMAYTLSNKLLQRTILVQVITEDVVTCVFGHSVVVLSFVLISTKLTKSCRLKYNDNPTLWTSCFNYIITVNTVVVSLKLMRKHF